LGYKTGKEDEQSPGPKYNHHQLDAMGNMANVKDMKDASFGNLYQKYDKVFFRGADNHFYGREGLGPGAYYNSFNDDNSKLSTTKSKSALKYSVPRGDRGLLNPKKNNSPSPSSYN